MFVLLFRGTVSRECFHQHEFILRGMRSYLSCFTSVRIEANRGQEIQINKSA